MTAIAISSRAFALLLAAVLTTAGGSLTSANAGTGDNGSVKGQEKIKKVPRGDKIGAHDRELLAEAVRKGKPTVTVMMATRMGGYDGRGITIGILDSGVDLDHPALTTTPTGERKIVDRATAADPLLEGDCSWRAMLTKVSGPTFVYPAATSGAPAGPTWTAPPGSFAISRFSESITAGSEPGGDVNRDGGDIAAFGCVIPLPGHHHGIPTRSAQAACPNKSRASPATSPTLCSREFSPGTQNATLSA